MPRRARVSGARRAAPPARPGSAARGRRRRPAHEPPSRMLPSPQRRSPWIAPMSAPGCGAALADIAPDVDLGTIAADADLAEAADLDSMDVLNLMAAIDASLGVSVPERDYPQLRTLDAMIDYLAARVPA